MSHEFQSASLFLVFILISSDALALNAISKSNNKVISVVQCSSISTAAPAASADRPKCVLFVGAANQHAAVIHNCLVSASSSDRQAGLPKTCVKIICKSDYKLEVNVTFEDGLPYDMDARITFEKVFCESCSDLRIEKFVVQIKPYCIGGRGVRYTIGGEVGSEFEDFKETILILNGGDDEFSKIYWMPESNSLAALSDSRDVPVIEADAEIVMIPCVALDTSEYIFYAQHLADPHEWVNLPVDGSVISYDADIGFILNTTLYPDYNNRFGCLRNASNFESHALIFNISDLPTDLVVIPSQSDVWHYTLSNAKDVVPHSGLPLVLECSHSTVVHLEGTLHFSNGTTIELAETSNFTLRLPKYRFTAKYLNTFLQPNDKLEMRCTRNGAVLHTWNVVVEDIRNSLNLEFRQVESKPSYYCASSTFDDASLRFMYCYSPIHCNLIRSCLEKGPTHPCRNISRVHEGYNSICDDDNDRNYTSCQRAAFGGGVLACSAGNRAHKFVEVMFPGHDEQQYFQHQSDVVPMKAKIKIVKNWPVDDEKEILLKTEVSVECRILRFFSEGNFLWLLELGDGSAVPFREDLVRVISSKFADFGSSSATNYLKIMFLSTEIKMIICRAPEWESEEWLEYKRNVTIIDPKPPEITIESEFILKIGAKNEQISCEATGLPVPQIRWSTQSGENISKPVLVEGKKLIFPEFKSTMVGIYVCNASNVAGFDVLEINVLEEQPDDDLFPLPLVLGVICGIGLLPVVTIITVVVYYRKKMDKLSPTELYQFFNGNISESDEQLGTIDFLKLPYPQEFEFAKEKLVIDKTKCLGSGEYGEVYFGSLDTKSGVQQVAVKIPKPGCPPELFRTLLSELKIMAYMGTHANVVGLIGAYTVDIRTGVLYIVIEFCEMGSLEDFFENNRHLFGKTAEFKHAAKGEYEGINDVIQASGFGRAELVQWCYEIASGMEFLSNQKIIHADLATRNVLLTTDRTAKVSDFGLSRRMYNCGNYVKTSSLGMPWRWLAIESLTSSIYSTMSDVWSFGITMWEIFSLGNVPYPGLDWDIEFGSQLSGGLRNTQPEHSCEEMYQIMTDCWNINPKKRPTFSELRQKLSGARRVYIQMRME